MKLATGVFAVAVSAAEGMILYDHDYFVHDDAFERDNARWKEIQAEKKAEAETKKALEAKLTRLLKENTLQEQIDETTKDDVSVAGSARGSVVSAPEFRNQMTNKDFPGSRKLKSSGGYGDNTAALDSASMDEYVRAYKQQAEEWLAANPPAGERPFLSPEVLEAHTKQRRQEDDDARSASLGSFSARSASYKSSSFQHSGISAGQWSQPCSSYTPSSQGDAVEDAEVMRQALTAQAQQVNASVENEGTAMEAARKYVSLSHRNIARQTEERPQVSAIEPIKGPFAWEELDLAERQATIPLPYKLVADEESREEDVPTVVEEAADIAKEAAEELKKIQEEEAEAKAKAEVEEELKKLLELQLGGISALKSKVKKIQEEAAMPWFEHEQENPGVAKLSAENVSTASGSEQSDSTPESSFPLKPSVGAWLLPKPFPVQDQTQSRENVLTEEDKAAAIANAAVEELKKVQEEAGADAEAGKSPTWASGKQLEKFDDNFRSHWRKIQGRRVGLLEQHKQIEAAKKIQEEAAMEQVAKLSEAPAQLMLKPATPEELEQIKKEELEQIKREASAKIQEAEKVQRETEAGKKAIETRFAPEDRAKDRKRSANIAKNKAAFDKLFGPSVVDISLDSLSRCRVQKCTVTKREGGKVVGAFKSYMRTDDGKNVASVTVYPRPGAGKLLTQVITDLSAFQLTIS